MLQELQAAHQLLSRQRTKEVLQFEDVDEPQGPTKMVMLTELAEERVDLEVTRALRWWRLQRPVGPARGARPFAQTPRPTQKLPARKCHEAAPLKPALRRPGTCRLAGDGAAAGSATAQAALKEAGRGDVLERLGKWRSRPRQM